MSNHAVIRLRSASLINLSIIGVETSVRFVVRLNEAPSCQGLLPGATYSACLCWQCSDIPDPSA